MTLSFFIAQDNKDLLKANEESQAWMAYVDYIDEIIVDGFFNTIHCSLKFLLDNTVPRPQPEPLFEAVFELKDAELVFTPSLDFSAADGFYDLVDGLTGDIFKQSAQIERVARHTNQDHYQVQRPRYGLPYTRGVVA